MVGINLTCISFCIEMFHVSGIVPWARRFREPHWIIFGDKGGRDTSLLVGIAWYRFGSRCQVVLCHYYSWCTLASPVLLHSERGFMQWDTNSCKPGSQPASPNQPPNKSSQGLEPATLWSPALKGWATLPSQPDSDHFYRSMWAGKRDQSYLRTVACGLNPAYTEKIRWQQTCGS